MWYNIFIMKNPYSVLGVSANAPIEDCKKAYRKLSRKYHPDNGGDEVLFHEVQEAWKAIESGNFILVIERKSLKHKTLFSFV